MISRVDLTRGYSCSARPPLGRAVARRVVTLAGEYTGGSFALTANPRCARACAGARNARRVVTLASRWSEFLCNLKVGKNSGVPAGKADWLPRYSAPYHPQTAKR